jgi:Methyltransferase domain
MTPQDVLADVIKIAPSLHTAGTFAGAVLGAIFRHASGRSLERSVETGCGASTLLLSHLSRHHTVFAIDAGTGSVRSVQSSALLRREAVTFVEGPTQLTLPAHTFTGGLQLALIDGPHGYPFPDLEYYYLYQHLDRGAVLIIDDIHIPTITNLFDFLCADEMFAVEEVVETTAFFRRTDAATFSPIGDHWWTQGYNRRAFESSVAERVTVATPDRTDTPTPFHVDQFGPFANPLALGSLSVPQSEPLTITGWAIDAGRRRPATALDLVIDGIVYRAAVRMSRGDVATAYGDRAYLRSGFSSRLPEGAITQGFHELEIRVVLNGGLQYYPAAHLSFEVV